MMQFGGERAGIAAPRGGAKRRKFSKVVSQSWDGGGRGPKKEGGMGRLSNCGVVSGE